jgi:hypothetical protein
MFQKRKAGRPLLGERVRMGTTIEAENIERLSLYSEAKDKPIGRLIDEDVATRFLKECAPPYQCLQRPSSRTNY